MYPAVALINHSCVPNVALEFRNGDATASVVAMEDLAKGVEVAHSYVDQDTLDDLEERRNALGQYEFLCTCPKCRPSTSVVSKKLDTKRKASAGKEPREKKARV